MSKPVDFIFFGGAFDPPHIGHLQVALFLQQSFKDIPIHIVPNLNSPFKGDLATAFKHRLAMCNTLFKDQKNIFVDDIESKTGGINYTLTTLQKMIKDEVGKNPALVIGDDQLEQFEKWKDHQKILELVTLVVIPRVKTPKEILDKIKFLSQSKLSFIEEGGIFKEKVLGFYIVGDRLSAASSTECRNGFSETSQDDKLLDLTPEVKKYIEENRLYLGVNTKNE